MKQKKAIVPDKTRVTRNQTGPGRRILVVDDESVICEMSSELLLRRGYAVNIMTDGDLAWQALQSCRYDLLITDQNMPGLSGVELVRRVRAARMTLPVIMISGMTSGELLSRDKSLRLSAVLPKPFTVDEFVQTVEAVLQMHPDGVGSYIASPPATALAPEENLMTTLLSSTKPAISPKISNQ